MMSADLTIDEASELTEGLCVFVAEKLEQGWTLQPECTFELHERKCCVLGAVVPGGKDVWRVRPSSDAVLNMVEDQLGITENVSNEIILAFDFGDGAQPFPEELPQLPNAFAVGLWFRERYVQ